MRNKFVSALRPVDYAEQLHEAQREIQKLEAKLKVLKSNERHLQSYLLKYAKGESFIYHGLDGFEKKVRISNHSRLILDTETVKKLLKSRTPYRTSSWTSVDVDWVYE